MNRIVAALSKLLEPEERECACGDLEEWRLGGVAAAANILGLVIRRQLAEWSRWGPWAALWGVAGLTGCFLSGLFLRVEGEISLQIRTYLHYGVAYQPGGVNFAQIAAHTVTGVIVIALWSWACGFVLASLSGRAFWITSLLFYLMLRDSFLIRAFMSGTIVLKQEPVVLLHRLLPLDPFVMACLFMLAIGVRASRKDALRQNTSLYLAAFGFALIVLLVWMESWFAAGFAQWSGEQYFATPFLYRLLPWLAGAWPIFSIPLIQNRRQTARGATS